jgi:solute carrier family 25 carnitine/acylcarnitine transporter 20/29
VWCGFATVTCHNEYSQLNNKQTKQTHNNKKGTPLTLREQMAAAVGASAAVSVVATPTELMKCRLQAQGCSKTALAKLVAAGVDPRTVCVVF